MFNIGKSNKTHKSEVNKYDVFAFRHSKMHSIACSYRAATGFLYPLERGFAYVHKPPLYIRFEEVASVNFGRSAGSTRSFDFDVETTGGATYNFVGIEKCVSTRGSATALLGN